MGTVLGTLLSCCCLGGFLFWLLPAVLSAGGNTYLFLVVASPLLSLGYGLFTGLESMRTNRCAALIPGAVVPLLHLAWVVNEIAASGSGSD